LDQVLKEPSPTFDEHATIREKNTRFIHPSPLHFIHTPSSVHDFLHMLSCRFPNSPCIHPLISFLFNRSDLSVSQSIYHFYRSHSLSFI
jgi:hypothetical protein